MQRTLYLLLLIFIPCLAAGASNIDSLFALLPTLQGEEKMNVYYKLNNEYYTLNDLEGHLDLLNRFIADAEKEGNTKYLTYGHSAILSVLTNYGENKRFEEALPAKLKIFEKYEEWYHYFFAIESYTAKLIYQKRYAETIDYANQVLTYAQERGLDEGIGMANYILGRVYTHMQRYPDAEPAFLASIEAYKRMPKKNYNIATTYLRYVDLLYRTQRPDEMKKWLDEWGAYLDSQSTTGQYDYYPLYINYINYHLAMGNATEAERYIDRVEGLTQVLSTTVGKLQYYNKKADLRRMQKRYPEALAFVDSLQHYCQLAGDELGVAHTMRQRAEISAEAGLHQQAYQSLFDFMAVNDSVQRLEINKQLDELRTQYEVDRHVEARRLSHAYAILAAVAALLLTLAFIIYIVYSRREAARVRALMAATHRTEVSMRHVGQTQGLPLHDADDRLYQSIIEYMSTDHPYTNPDLTRKDVSTALNTNETYIYRTIKQNTGLSFQEYLYYLRLEYARRLLADQDNNDTIESIAEAVGYRSRKTFHIHFRNRYEMTPYEYRTSVVHN